MKCELYLPVIEGSILKFAVPNPEFTFFAGIKPQKRYRATSRKRFVKLCMADGESRNFANLLAETARENHHSYQLEYFSLTVGAETLRNVILGKYEPQSAETQKENRK